MNEEKLESKTSHSSTTSAISSNSKLIRVSDFRKKYFEGTAPSADSIKKMIRLGELKGTKLLGVYYVVIDDQLFAGNTETLDNFYESGVDNKVVPIPEKMKTTGSKADSIFAKYAHAV